MQRACEESGLHIDKDRALGFRLIELCFSVAELIGVLEGRSSSRQKKSAEASGPEAHLGEAPRPEESTDSKQRREGARGA